MDKRLGILAGAIVIALLAVCFAGCGDDGPGDEPVVYNKASTTENFSGYVGDPEHGTEPSSITFTIGGNGSLVTKATVTLSWQDDESSDNSDPDELRLRRRQL